MNNEALERLNERLDGTVYIAVAGSEIELGAARDSIEAIVKRPGDEGPVYHRATKGFEARQAHVEHFYRNTAHAFILLLDGDMEFKPDCLEVLRSHGLPVVSGLAYRRQWRPTIIPAWYEDDPEFRWPMQPFVEVPEPGRLYRLGATGFFCMLIHRSVFEAVEPLLKGERFVQEDDMDVWPYDLEAVLRGDEKLRVLRGTKDNVGADLRLSFFIRQAGFTIWGDPAVHCGHYVNYPLGLNDYSGFSRDYRQQFSQATRARVADLRAEQQAQIDALKGVTA